jgi:hypothetical protein
MTRQAERCPFFPGNRSANQSADGRVSLGCFLVRTIVLLLLPLRIGVRHGCTGVARDVLALRVASSVQLNSVVPCVDCADAYRTHLYILYSTLLL